MVKVNTFFETLICGQFGAKFWGKIFSKSQCIGSRSTASVFWIFLRPTFRLFLVQEFFEIGGPRDEGVDTSVGFDKSTRVSKHRPFSRVPLECMRSLTVNDNLLVQSQPAIYQKEPSRSYRAGYLFTIRNNLFGVLIVNWKNEHFLSET